ncbi:MAG: iron-sulfur cluster assembly protein, partial [Blastocatellia bacterium]
AVYVKMTLTAPNCPEAASIPGRVDDAIKSVDGVTTAKVELTFEPPWEPCRMSEAARLQLNMF